jgi:hypothetical protein
MLFLVFLVERWARDITYLQETLGLWPFRVMKDDGSLAIWLTLESRSSPKKQRLGPCR